jgi:hypothetical protein
MEPTGLARSQSALPSRLRQASPMRRASFFVSTLLETGILSARRGDGKRRRVILRATCLAACCRAGLQAANRTVLPDDP